MAPKVDDIIQTTSADDLLDTYSSSSALDDYGLDDINLDDYGLEDFDLDNYDDYLDDYDLDSFDTDDYLDDFDSSFDDYGSDDYSSDDFDSSLDDFDSGFDSTLDDDDMNLSGGPSAYDFDDYGLPDSSNYYVGGVGLDDIWYYGAAGIYGVGLLAFIVLLLVTLFAGLRKNDGTKPVIVVILSLVFFIFWSIFSIIHKVALSGVGMDANAITAMSVLSTLTFSVAQVLVFCAFYRFLSDRFDRLSKSGGFHGMLKNVHWGILGLLGVLYAVRVILTIAIEAKLRKGDLDFDLQDSAIKYQAALDILSWLFSIEILGCSVLTLLQRRSGGSIGSPLTLCIAAFAFFIGWLTNAVISIRFKLTSALPPAYLIIVETIFWIVPLVVIYICFVVLLAKSDRWESTQDQGMQQEPVQYQQPMADNQYKQPEPQYAPVPGPVPAPYPQPSPPPQQAAGTPPPQAPYQQPQYYQQPQQPQGDYAQPQAQYAQVPVPAPYPSQSPHPA